MSRIRGRNTGPERALRSALRAAGIPYRSYLRLPGRPDVALARARVAVFVHGCFWHGCPHHYTAPRTRAEFWRKKLEDNRDRDLRNTRALRVKGWRVITVWECQVEKRLPSVVSRLRRLSQAAESKAPPARRPSPRGAGRRSRSG